MKIKYNISKNQAREFLLAHQNLLNPRSLNGKDDILDFVNKVGCVQYDPLDQVGQNHHLFFQARVKNYEKELAEELLYKERKLIDGWDKNKSIYSVSDRPYFEKYRKEAYQKYYHKADSKVKKLVPVIREIFNKEGPLSSTDLNFDTKVNWSWSPARISKVVLESMYKWGELIIHHRKGTKKVYGLAKKYLPDNIYNNQKEFKTEQEYFNWHLLRRTGSIGLIRNLSETTWLGIKGLKKKQRDQAIIKLIKENKLIPIKIRGLKRNYYIRQNEEELLNDIISGFDYEKEIAFLAPLDNLIWNRKMIQDIFDFNYKWEVYKPANQRKYGYYVLPILFGDKFIGRFEPKYDKTNKSLKIKNWWWEKDFKLNNSIKGKIQEAISSFMNYLGAEYLSIKDEKVNFLK